MYAIIDIGTNTLILLVAKKKGKKGIDVLCDEAVITRLGQGLFENHFFDSEAMKRTLKTLGEFKTTCKKLKVKKIITIGTASCRTAANSQVFVDALKQEHGLKLEIITGNQEAELVFGSVCHDFGKIKNKLLVVDIGGGSTEIITGPLNSKKKAPETVISLPLGSVRLTEQYVTTDPIAKDQFDRLLLACKNGLNDELDGFYSDSLNLDEHEMVATAGTATTLACLDKKMDKYDPDKIHGSILKKENLKSLIYDLAKKNVKERQKMPGMELLRADVILAGALLLNETMNYFKKDKVIISDRGLRYGVFYKRFLK